MKLPEYCKDCPDTGSEICKLLTASELRKYKLERAAFKILDMVGHLGSFVAAQPAYTGLPQLEEARQRLDSQQIDVDFCAIVHADSTNGQAQ